jgi:hypothetical protein
MTSRVGGGNTKDQTRCRNDAIVCPKYHRSQKSDAMTEMLFTLIGHANNLAVHTSCRSVHL